MSFFIKLALCFAMVFSIGCQRKVYGENYEEAKKVFLAFDKDPSPSAEKTMDTFERLNKIHYKEFELQRNGGNRSSTNMAAIQEFMDRTCYKVKVPPRPKCMDEGILGEGGYCTKNKAVYDRYDRISEFYERCYSDSAAWRF
jgi:hypothetical protein